MSTPNAGSAKLNSAERKLLAAVTSGTVVDLRAGDADLDNPANAANWDSTRNVRAEFLAELLTGEQTQDSSRLRAVKLRGARITGALDLEARKLLCPLVLQGCFFEDSVNLNEAESQSIRLPGCHVPALTADQLRTAGNVELDDAFTAIRGISFLAAHIGGHLGFDGASLTNMQGTALMADMVAVDKNVSCHRLTAHGEIRFPGADIGGQLNLCGASLANERGTALVADMLAVHQDMLCCHGFTAHGEISLPGAHIGGRLTLAGATLANQSRTALSAHRMTVDQDMICESVTAHGEINLHGAHIGGQLTLDRATLTNPAYPARVALDLDAASIGTLALSQMQPDDAIDLTNAKVGVFYDDQESWPTILCLRGFVYDSFANHDISTRDRLRWLTRHPDRFAPEIYDQLASTYRRVGDQQAARKAAIAKQRRGRHAFSPLSWLWYLTVGYGYRPWLAGAWLIALAALGTAVFSHAYPAHMIATSPHPPAFHAAGYAFDLLLPVAGLGQKGAWQPQGSAYQYWSWAFIGAGWVLTTAFVAGLTGILKRD